MNKSKVITDMLVILGSLILFIIWYEGRYQNTISTSSTLEDYKVYLITMEKTSQYWYILDQGASDMAKLLGVTYIWDAPQKRIVDEQIEIIRNAVKNGANALMIAASDPVKVSGAIEDAKAVGVKIIYVDAPAYEKGIITFATDNYSAGVTAGQTMILELESIGIKTGSIGIIGVTLENETTMDREEGFKSVIEADGRFKLLNTQYANGDSVLAQSQAEAFIADNSDLVGIFGTNEDTTIGVGNTIKVSKKEIIGIGFDLTGTIQELIDEGYLKAVMVQNPYVMGYLGMGSTIAALKGFDTGPPFINTGVSIRTKYSY
ncbi:MAG: substrate-binding domain-containing protein [Mobilitalea sp.]